LWNIGEYREFIVSWLRMDRSAFNQLVLGSSPSPRTSLSILLGELWKGPPAEGSRRVQLKASGNEVGDEIIECYSKARGARGLGGCEQVGEKQAEQDAVNEDPCLHETLTAGLRVLARILDEAGDRDFTTRPSRTYSLANHP
jgi:hypothetical protein